MEYEFIALLVENMDYLVEDTAHVMEYTLGGVTFETRRI